MSHHRKKEKGAAEPALTEAAEAITAAIEEMARLSGRAAEVDPTSWADIVRGGELLGKATGAHEKFVTALTALTQEIGQLRDRHNGYVEQLAQAASRIDEQRVRYGELEERFGVIATAAREIDELARAAPEDAGEDATVQASAVSARFAAVRERLTRAVEDTARLAEDAREARLSDLEKRAVAARQQLEGLLGRIATTAGPAA